MRRISDFYCIMIADLFGSSFVSLKFWIRCEIQNCHLILKKVRMAVFVLCAIKSGLTVLGKSSFLYVTEQKRVTVVYSIPKLVWSLCYGKVYILHNQIWPYCLWDLLQKICSIWFETFPIWSHCGFRLDKAKDLLLVRKFVRRMKGSKHKQVNGQIFEKAANLWP